MPLADEHFCPISDSLLGRLYRSSPEGIASLVKTVPSRTRAMLAYYCSRRAHLEALGLSIALTCSEEELYDVAGRAGLVLAERARGAMTNTEPTKLKSRQGITLASGSLWQSPKPKD